MWLLIVYLVLVVLGQFAGYLIGLLVEHMWGMQASLIAFLALYFVFMWVAWVGAVKITAPRAVAKAA